MSDSLQKFNGNTRNELTKFDYVPHYPSSIPENDNLDPKKIIALLLRYKWLVLLFLIAGGTGAWFYSDTIEPIYESKGLLMISSNGENGNEELSQIISQATGHGTSSTLENELQVLQSRTFSKQIAQNLLDEPGESIKEFPILWGKKENGERYRVGESTITSRIKNNLSFLLPQENSDVVSVGFKSTSPEEAAKITNLAMQIYVERSTRQNRQAATSTALFLEKEKADVKQKLDESERRLREFMDNTGIVKVDEQTSGMVQEQSNVELELQRARLDLNTVENRMSNLEQQLERIKPGLSEQFSEAIGPKIRNAQEDLARYERERTLIIVKNPDVLEREPLPSRIQYLDKQIARLKTEIKNLSDQLFTEDDEYMGMETEDRAQLVSDIQAQLAALSTEKSQLTSQIEGLTEFRNELNANIDSLPKGIVELRKRQRDVNIYEDLYANVSRLYADMSVLKQSQFGFGRVVDPGEIPNIPVSPNKKILLLLGIMLGGLFSASIIFIKEFLDNSVNSVGDLKKGYLPSVSVVPKFDKIPRRKRKDFSVGEGKIPAELVLLQDKASISSEAIRRLKNNIIYQYGDWPPKTVAVTSAEKGDGKSTIVANLGIAFAEDGYKTLLIGADFRRPKLGKYLGLSSSKGLSDYLEGKLSFEDLIKDTDEENLKIIVSGENTQTPETLGSSMLFKQLLRKMEDVYDVIILDTPPFGIISDSTSILKYAESTVVVAKYRKTNQGILLRTLEELENIQANVTGIVLNDFDYRKETSNYYGAGYYRSLYTNYESYAK